MPASLLPFPKFRAVDASGNPLVGGKLFSYAAGTTTPLATFSDSTGNTANANPITLNASGEADVWFASQAYKLSLQDATGNILWTVDNINGAGGAGVAGFIVVTFSATPVFNASAGNAFYMLLTGNVTGPTLTNAQIGQEFTFIFVQDGTGGHTVTWPTNVDGADIDGTARAVNIQKFIYLSDNIAHPTTPMTVS